ncbi:MAG: hypothetical protein ACR2OZ_14695 [Verrucomicrobiales bacterium]
MNSRAAGSPTLAGLTRRWRWGLVIAGFVFLSGMLAYSFWPGREARPVHVALTRSVKMPPPAVPSEPKEIVDEIPIDRTAAASEASIDPIQRLRILLKNFYLPEVNFESTPVAEALASLLRAIAELNHLDRQELTNLRLLLQTPEGIGDAGSRVTLKQRGMSLFTVLGVLAAQTGRAIEIGDGLVTLVPGVAPGGSVEQVRTVFVPEAWKLGAAASIDPFASSDTYVVRHKPSLLDGLRDWGFQEIDESALVRIENGFQLALPNVGSNFAIADGLKHLSREEGSRLISVVTNLMEFTSGASLDDQLLEKDDFQRWKQAQLANPNVTSISTPQLTTRNDQQATIEVMREVPASPSADADWQGARLKVHPMLEGEVLHLRGTVEVRRPPGTAQPLLPVGSRPEPPILESQIANVDAIIPPGQTAVFSLTDNSSGPRIFAAISASIIDPSGRVVSPLPRLGSE